MKQMKPLKSNFLLKGFTFSLIKREGDRAIYKKTRAVDNCSFVGFEVIKVGKHNGYNIGGVFVEPSEMYPGDSLWGRKGFTFTSLEQAEKFFTETDRL